MKRPVMEESADARDEVLTYEVLASCIGEKREELESTASLNDAIREEYEQSLSFRIGRLLCRHSR